MEIARFIDGQWVIYNKQSVNGVVEENYVESIPTDRQGSSRYNLAMKLAHAQAQFIQDCGGSAEGYAKNMPHVAKEQAKKFYEHDERELVRFVTLLKRW